jgi:hypothetical protein
MTANNKQKILDLYSQIDSLYEQISLLEGEMGWLDTYRGEGNEYLRDVLNVGPNTKWKDAIPVMQKSYGPDFCYPGTNAYRKLSMDMYEQLGMPKAPDRNDHSDRANQLRQLRKDIRSKTFTYISRMRKYLEQSDQ